MTTEGSYREVDKDSIIEDLHRQITELKSQLKTKRFNVGATVSAVYRDPDGEITVCLRFNNGVEIKIGPTDEQFTENLQRPTVGDEYRMHIVRK